MRTTIAILLVIATFVTISPLSRADAPLVEKYLTEGKLAEGERALNDALKTSPNDAQARFSLGTLQFLRAVERLVQSFHHHGMKSNVLGNMVPMARLPIPKNDAPAPISYADLRAIFQAWNDDLAKAEATLGRVDDPSVKLSLHFGEIHLDLDGNGKADPEETLWKLYAQLNGPARNALTPEAAREFVITFDRGDVAWLRGYCHLLATFGEVYLAHDGKELFEHTAHLFFPKPMTPFAFLQHPSGEPFRQFDTAEISDYIAFIHLLRLPVSEPKRMSLAHWHLEQMIALSRESWRFILAETDDDHEWVPNPKQSTVVPGGAVTDAMVKGWMEFLDEAQAVLKGEKLIPFWRAHEERGVNLRRVFSEPRTFDAPLWLQGTAAAPYLENGEKTRPETWQRFQRIFGGQFIGFAIWFN